jgi:cobalt-zinc-cadmium resistance protein CzcA
MLRCFLLVLSFTILQTVNAQVTITRDEAIDLAVKNQRNLQAANLMVQQQQQLLRGSAGLDDPTVFVEASPYEPLLAGIEQSFSLPGVYRNRKALQNERIRLVQLQLQGSQYDLKREVSFSYLQLQYFTERFRLFSRQDSVYQAIKTAARRFFEAGQINKLEELQAATQADQVRNELLRTRADLAAETQIFRFYTNMADSFNTLPIGIYLFTPVTISDTAIFNIQQQILQQQIAISQKELQVSRSELLPRLQAGVLFPTTKEYERPIGYQLGISIPLWQRQNRSRIEAAKTGIEIAKAQQELEQYRLHAQYRQSLLNYQRELNSLTYFRDIAIPQAEAIMETSRRLFDGGELNYIESLRNLQSAFDIFMDHLETHRALNEAVIHLHYLNGTL